MPRLKVTSPSSVRIEYEFGDVAVSIGREMDNMIVLDDPKISRHHAEVTLHDGAWWLGDLDSTHGIWAQGKRVKKLILKDRESFSIGDHKFRFILLSHGGAASQEKAPSHDSAQRGKKQKHKRGVFADGTAASKSGNKSQGEDKVPAPASESPVKLEKEEAKSGHNEASSVAIPPVINKHTDKTFNIKCLNAWMLYVAGVVLLGGAVSLFYQYRVGKLPDAEVPRHVEKPRLKLPQTEPAEVTSMPKAEQPSAKRIATAGRVLAASGLVSAAGSSPLADEKKVERIPIQAAEVGMLLPQLRAPDIPPAEPALKPLATKNSEQQSAEVTKSEATGEAMAAKKTEAKTAEMAAVKPDSRTVKKPELPPGASRLLFQPESSDTLHQPVISPDLKHVLHVFHKGDGKSSLGNLMLDEKVIRQGVRVATMGDMMFSPDGSKWMAFIADGKGQKTLLLPDRSYNVFGQIQAVLGSNDFTTMAHVERSAGEDSLFLNGVKVSTYDNITSPRLASSGKHWAYVAMKRLDADWEVFAPGERVVTDAWNGPIHDHISDLTVGGENGERVAYVSYGPNGAQKLWLDRKAVCEVKAYSGGQILKPSFAPAGSSFAWMVLTKEGMVECHANDAPPVTVDVSGVAATPTLFSRATPTTRIAFSADGRHLAFAVVGRSAVIVQDGAVIGNYPSAQADSLVFSPDGTRLAYVALHPLRGAEESAEGISTQPHAAVLNVNAKAVHTAPVSAHKLPGMFPVTLGRFGRCQFSPDSLRLAYLFTPEQQESNPRCEFWVDRRKALQQGESVEAFNWVDRATIQLVCHRDNSLWIYSLECAE